MHLFPRHICFCFCFSVCMPIRRWLKLARSGRSGRLGSACSMPVLCVLYMLYISAARSCGSLACRFAGGSIVRMLTSVIALIVISSCTLSHVTYALLLLFCLHAISPVPEARPLRSERASFSHLRIGIQTEKQKQSVCDMGQGG